MSKSKFNSIHEKAIRLLEGGVVEVDGLSVKAVKLLFVFSPCDSCEMDSLCHKGTEMSDVCKECDSIGNCDYSLKLVNNK